MATRPAGKTRLFAFFRVYRTFPPRPESGVWDAGDCRCVGKLCASEHTSKKKSERERAQYNEITNSFIGVLLLPPWPPFLLPCHTLMNFNLYVRSVCFILIPLTPIFINHVFFQFCGFILPLSIIHPDSNITERESEEKENKTSQHLLFLQCFITLMRHKKQ